MSCLYVNEDNQSFYRGHPASDMTEAGVDELVDVIVGTTPHLAGIAFCVNVQRALFESEVWETFYGDYDPAQAEDQPCLQRGHGLEHLWLLNQRGIDHHARWLARCRHHGIEGWLSMRMNDCHYLQEYEQRSPEEDPDAYWPGTYWREHPELRRAPYRWERSWEGAFDYGKPEVREHHLKLVRELLRRYNMFGLELDWMRWGMMFAPGFESAGRAILTEFMREVRRLADESAGRVGHPVRIAVRVPVEPKSCLALGFDVPAWADEQLVNMVILSSMLGCANFDCPVELWRNLLGPEIKLLANIEGVARSHPGMGSFAESRDFSFGAAASALYRGVDGIHLFNHCMKKHDLAVREYLADIFRTAPDLEALKQRSRRHAVTYPQVYAAGQASGAVLPLPLQVPVVGRDFGRMEENITLRIMLGPAPQSGTVCLQLGFCENTPQLAADQITVRVNGTVCHPRPECPGVFGDPPEPGAISPSHGEPPEEVNQVLLYEVPLLTLHNDVNVVEFVPPQVSGQLVWAEMLVVPVK